MHKRLKAESDKYPLVKITLGEWEFLKKDLIPLLIFHKQDKKLSFLTVMLLVQLTEIPQKGDQNISPEAYEKLWISPKNQHCHKMIEIMRSYKEAFLRPQVISVLMEHMSDCLQVEEMNDKHMQMVELIIVLFKQLLQIPDPKYGETNTLYAEKGLQKNLLLLFH